MPYQLPGADAIEPGRSSGRPADQPWRTTSKNGMQPLQSGDKALTGRDNDIDVKVTDKTSVRNSGFRTRCSTCRGRLGVRHIPRILIPKKYTFVASGSRTRFKQSAMLLA